MIKKLKYILKYLLAVAFLSTLIGGSAYLQWWRCGEMFPQAQLACFIGSK